jgi:hypothetical protein
MGNGLKSSYGSNVVYVEQCAVTALWIYLCQYLTLGKWKAKGDSLKENHKMKLVSRVNAIIYGKENPEWKPYLTVCRFG